MNNIVAEPNKDMSKKEENTLLFIADISGFTKFLNETEISHSSHIISELLELVIKKNNLNLKVAEIEGDAVFFYNKGPAPKIQEIVHQAKKMFVSFHEHLKIYERDRICQCGACVGASNLSLKFITHQCNVVFQDIGGSLQLMGKGVTLAHKLLKNDVDSNEYLLVSDNIELSEKEKSEFSFKESKTSYQDIGEVGYKVSFLSGLQESISIPSANRIRKQRTKNPIVKNIKINSSVEKTHEVLIDLTLRSVWKTETIFDDRRVERIGTMHECILPQGSVMGYVIDNIVKKDEIIYEEYTDRYNFLFPSLSEVYHLKSIDETHCEMKVEFHIHGNKLVRSFWRPLLNKGVKKGIDGFVKLCTESK